MTTINDFGAAGDPLNNPSRAAWAAAVRDKLLNLDARTSVLEAGGGGGGGGIAAPGPPADFSLPAAWQPWRMGLIRILDAVNQQVAAGTIVKATVSYGGAADAAVQALIKGFHTVDFALPPADTQKWVQVDVDWDGSGRRINPTYASIRQRVGDYSGYNKFQQVEVLGSEDGTTWTQLGDFSGGSINTANSAWNDLDVTDTGGPWRYIRWHTAQLDTNGAAYFCIGGLELFGEFV